VIDVGSLTKSYGDNLAVGGVDLTVGAGEVFALLGPNGAGKTTIVEILEGHRDRTSGTVSVLGHDPGRGELELRRRVGIVLQSTGVERFLTVGEVVDQFRSFYPHPRPRDEVLDAVGLAARRDERVGRLSGGQQRRLDVAVGLAGDPELLFLDEPTTGFDPGARREAWEMVRNLRHLGKTVFLTTHYMDEAQALADRVAVIAAGKIVAQGRPDSLAGRQRMDATVSFTLPDGVQPPAGLGLAPDEHGRWAGPSAEPTRLLAELAPWALAEGVTLGRLQVLQPTLEDVYLSLIGHTSDASDDGDRDERGATAPPGRRRR
jgi:ABC-2 type transport system ATP-binding protein